MSPDGEAMEAAGTFQSGGDTTAFRLSQAVPENGLVAVTLEDEGGSDAADRRSVPHRADGLERTPWRPRANHLRHASNPRR